MIEILQEVTEWNTPIYNGIYHVNAQGQLVAYENSEGLKEFISPMKGFSKSRRKFVKIGERTDIYRPDVRRVEGSNGKIYIITDGKCSCPGFMYRGDCKHARNS